MLDDYRQECFGISKPQSLQRCHLANIQKLSLATHQTISYSLIRVSIQLACPFRHIFLSEYLIN